MNPSRCTLLSLTFLITGLFDAVLQLADRGWLPPVEWLVGDSDWYVSLTKDGGYFDRHTPLAAILLAGIVGFGAQAIILSIVDFPKGFKSSLKFFLVTFIVSALFGLLMNDAWPVSTRLFPIISQTYYKDLGKPRSMVTDGESGIIVNLTLLILVRYAYPFLVGVAKQNVSYK